MKQDTNMMSMIATAPATATGAAVAEALPAEEPVTTGRQAGAFDAVLAIATGLVAGRGCGRVAAGDSAQDAVAATAEVPPGSLVPACPVVIAPAGAAPVAAGTIEETLQAIEAGCRGALLLPGPQATGDDGTAAPSAKERPPVDSDFRLPEPSAAGDASGAPRNTATANEAASASRLASPLTSRVGAEGWPNELATRLVWLAKDDVQAASMRLSPAHLGVLEVRIAVCGDEATVSFGASHADTRAALEQALPKLRELLAAQGLQLAHADVSGRDPREADARPAHHALRDASRAETGSLDAPSAVRVHTGLLDLYA